MKMAYSIFQVEYAESCAKARQVAVELQSRRKEFVSQAFSTIFPIEVEPLSPQDAGEEGEVEVVRCQMEKEDEEGVEGGWGGEGEGEGRREVGK